MECIKVKTSDAKEVRCQCTAGPISSQTPSSTSIMQMTKASPNSILRLRQLALRMLDELMPSACTLCGGKSHDAICPRCCKQYANCYAARCTCCAIRLPECSQSTECGSCLARPPAFDLTFAASDYAPPIDQLLQALKFHAKLPLAKAFGRLLSELPVPRHTADLIIAVPLSLDRLAERGFNQSLEIARALAQHWKLPLATNVCLRVKHTQTQASLPVHQRRVNMRNAFAVQNSQLIVGKRILLVDDVMTTGHTLNELADCLKRHGAAHVTNFVVARTPIR
jgi:ComF family protein